MVTVDSVPGGKVTGPRNCTATPPLSLSACSMALNHLSTRLTLPFTFSETFVRLRNGAHPHCSNCSTRHATHRTKWRSLCRIKLTQDFVHCFRLWKNQKRKRGRILTNKFLSLVGLNFSFFTDGQPNGLMSHMNGELFILRLCNNV
jgi:hypothetical protein